MLIGGRYETIRELGRGGIGKTYLAEDTYRRGSPKCVVKKLQLSLNTPPLLEKARAIFEAEAQVLYQLGEHEQIPRLFAHFEQNGEFYLIQELIDGHDLRQAFALGDRWDEKAILAFLREILEILEFVHHHQTVHQDLKPENLIRRWHDKKLEIIDFCSIKAIRNLTINETSEIGFSHPLGTPAYMPSEQALGLPQFCSDLYAVGMMGIQAATGYMPNQLPRNPETKDLEWHDQASISSELSHLLDGMVRYDFRHRYQSVRAVLDALPTPNNSRAAAIASFNLLLQEAKPPQYDLVIPPQFEIARNFSEGLAAVVLHQKLGYINKWGTFVIAPELEFDWVNLLREGAYQFSEGLTRLSVGDRWGYLNLDGEIAIKPQFDGAEPFSQGLARIELNHRYGYIDQSGNWAIPPQFESAAPAFREALTGVEIEHRYGYIDRSGTVVISPQFDTADEFGEGLARITLNDKYGFIDKAGCVVIPAQFDVAHTFSQGLARVRVDGKYGYIDRTGELVITPQFDDTFSFSHGLGLVCQDGKYGYINLVGETAIALQFDDAYPFSQGLAAVKVGSRWGYIDVKGDFVVALQFDDACSFEAGLAAVKLGGQWGYLGEMA